MKGFQKSGIALALAIAATTSVNVNAAISDIVQTGASANVAVTSTAVELTTIASGADSINTITSGGADPVVLQLGDIITITAANGKFDRAGLGATPVVITKAVGTTAAVVATWTLDATDKILAGTVTTASTADNTSDIITLTGSYDATGVASGTELTVDITVSRLVLGTATVVHKIGTASTPDARLVMTPAPQLFAPVPSANPAQTDTATVASSFLSLDGTSGTATTVVVTTSSLPITVLNDYQAGSATGTLFYKITGVPAAVTKIDYAVAGAILSQSDATGLVAPTTPTAAGDFWLDGSGNAFAKVTVAGTQSAVPATAMTLTFDGTTAIIPTNLAMEVDYLAGAGDKFVGHTPLSSTVISKVVRNGSAFSLNSAGALNKLKITDLSGAITASTGTISVTAYDAAGAMVSGSVTIPALTSNSTAVVNMVDVTTAFVGAVRFDFVVESTEIAVSNVKKTTSGTTSTTYRNSSDSAGTVVGNGTL